MSANTLFVRLEGPLQSWGVQESKFVIRRTARAPTKSGVLGMLCAALGVPRPLAHSKWLPKLVSLHMGVRIDTPGVRWWDYHTVGARMQMDIAEGKRKTKPGAMLTRREYLCDASFLVALQGDQRLIEKLDEAIRHPKSTLYLGRKSCPPSRPMLDHPAGDFPDLDSALKSVPWHRRLATDLAPQFVDGLLDWHPTQDQPQAPDDAFVWFDVPLTFEPPAHAPRFVLGKEYGVGAHGEINVASKALQNPTPPPLRPRANYRNSKYAKMRKERIERDHHLCVFCKSPANTVQHVTYRHAGEAERLDELRALCSLCYDAVTMIEYGTGMGMDRVDPCESRWRDAIIKKRSEIVQFRSPESRRRRLQPEEVE